MSFITSDGCEYVDGFSWQDCCVLAAMLVISCAIGFYYGFAAEAHTSSDDFLLGGSTMGTVPMALSLATSFVTAIELLGNPAEMYNYGTQFWLICVAFVLVVPITSRLYLPVYTKLRLTSSFEYLELRFSTGVRVLASGLYILQMVLYTSVAVYAPALALNHVTGLNTYIAVTLVYIVCIFYASQGGMKAVIIIDTFQTVVLFGSIFMVMLYGGYKSGFANVWQRSVVTERLQLFNMDLNPTSRHTFWSVTIGGTFYWTTMFCSNQASIQKYLSVAKISQVRCALWVSCVSLILTYTINFLTGMVLVEYYKDCDPLKNKNIDASDQILPLYVINVMGKDKGVPGFFVAGIFAASLGTVASALTSITAATCQDFITKLFDIKLQESKGALVARWISIVSGIISFALVFVIEQLGSVLQVALSFNGMVGGITLGLFSLGMFFPWANAKGALSGAIISLGFIAWICVGAQIAIAKGEIQEKVKYVSTDGCLCNNNTLHSTHGNHNTGEGNSSFYNISYLWYSPIGCIGTILLGMLISSFTKLTDPKTVPVDLQSPPLVSLYNSLPPKIKRILRLSEADVKLNSFGPRDAVDVPTISLSCDGEATPKNNHVI